MNAGRWYPGQVQLSDGRTVILGGYTDAGAGRRCPNQDLEVFRPLRQSGGVGSLAVKPSAQRRTGLYPHLFTLPPRGSCWPDPPKTDSAVLRTDDFTWREYPRLPFSRVGGNAVLDPGPSWGSWQVTEIGGYDGARTGTRTGISTAVPRRSPGRQASVGQKRLAGRPVAERPALLPEHGPLAGRLNGRRGRRHRQDGRRWQSTRSTPRGLQRQVEGGRPRREGVASGARPDRGSRLSLDCPAAAEWTGVVGGRREAPPWSPMGATRSRTPRRSTRRHTCSRARGQRIASAPKAGFAGATRLRYGSRRDRPRGLGSARRPRHHHARRRLDPARGQSWRSVGGTPAASTWPPRRARAWRRPGTTCCSSGTRGSPRSPRG